MASRKADIDPQILPVGKQIPYKKDNSAYKGVYARKAKSGIVTWYLNTKLHGKSQWIKIGTDIDGFGPEHVVAKRRTIELAKFTGDVTGGIKKSKSCTLAQAWAAWVDWKRSEGYSDQYIDVEINRFNKHIAPELGSLQLKALAQKPALINNLQGELRKKGLRENTIKQVMMNIKKAFKQAQAQDMYLGPIPFRTKADPSNQGVLIRNSKARRERWLSKAQAVTFMDFLKGLSERKHKLHAVSGLMAYRQSAFALYTGLRQGEVLKLNPKSINLDTMQIHVNKVKHASMADKSRYVDIPDILLPIIEDLLAEKDWKPTEKFFSHFAKKPFRTAVDHFEYNKGLKPNDIANRISFHSLRHTFGALLVEQGVHLVTIKEMMGHDTIEAVQIYAKAGPSTRKAAMDTFNKIW